MTKPDVTGVSPTSSSDENRLARIRYEVQQADDLLDQAGTIDWALIERAHARLGAEVYWLLSQLDHLAAENAALKRAVLGVSGG